MKSKIYFISDGRGLVKIGVANNVHRRLQGMGSHPAWVILGVLQGDYTTETMLHDKFQHLNESNEWFKCNTELIEYIILNCVPELLREDREDLKAMDKIKYKRRETTRQKTYSPEKQKAYYLKHKEKKLAYSKQWYQKNRERILEKRKA